MYAYGAPRVGDKRFSDFIESSDLSVDSANFVRFNNVVDKNTFYTQCDPICKMPPTRTGLIETAGKFYNLAFSDNPKIKITFGDFYFNDVFNLMSSQPDYDMTAPYSSLSKQTKLSNRCGKYFAQIHSVSSYDLNVMKGDVIFFLNRDYREGYEGFLDGIKYTEDCPESSSLLCKLASLPLAGGLINMGIGASAVGVASSTGVPPILSV